MVEQQTQGGAVLRSAGGGLFGLEVGAVLPGPLRVPGGAEGGRGAVRWVARSGRPAVEAGDEAGAWRVVAGGASRALTAALDGWLVDGRRVCLRPHREDALSDVPSTLGVLRAFAGRGVEVLVAPADLISGSMLRHAADHYVRIVSSLAGQPGVVGFLLEDVTAGAGEDAAACEPGQGLLPPRVWAEVFDLVRGATLVGVGGGWEAGLARMGWIRA